MSDLAPSPLSASDTPFFRRPLTGLIALSLSTFALIVALIVVYTTLSGQLSDSQAALDSLQQQTEANTAALEATTQTDLSKVTASLEAQTKRIGLLAECLPEIQSQLNRLNVETSWETFGDSRYLTSAYLSNDTIVSRVCQPVLNGS